MATRQYATIDDDATKWGEAVNFLDRGMTIEEVAELVGLPIETLTEWWTLLKAGQSIPGLHYAVVDNQPTPEELETRTAEAKAAQLRAKLEGDGGQHEYEPKLQAAIVGGCDRRRR